MRNRYTWLVPFVRPYVVPFAAVLVLSLVSTALSLSYPYFTSLLIDGVLIERKYSLISIVSLAFVAMASGYVLSAVNSLLYLRITLKMLRKLRTELLLRIERTYYDYFVRTKAGDIITRLNGDAAEVQGGMTDVVLSAIIQITTFLFVSVMLFWLNPLLAFTCFAFLPVLIGSLVYFRKQIVAISSNLRLQHSQLQSYLIEHLQAMKIIKLFSAENRTAQGFDRQIEGINQSSYRYSWLSTFAEGIPRIAILLSSMIIFTWGGVSVLSGEMSVGALVAFTGYQSRLFGPVQSLASLYLRVQRMNVSLKRLEELVHLPPEAGRPPSLDNDPAKLQEDTQSPAPQQERGEEPLVELRNVTFGYHPDRPLLKSVTARIFPGKTIALTGDSGQGKSSMIDLLTGLYRPTEGVIFFQGNILDTERLARVRLRVAVAVQQPTLFHTTVLENIRFGLPNASLSDVMEAAKLAGIHEEILQLPGGYDTVVGERGVSLSGGQRQRLALARTLLMPADLYIFDEATSEIDSRSERRLYQRLREAFPDRSLLFISHRPGSLDWVEQKWRLQDGHLYQEAEVDDEPA